MKCVIATLLVLAMCVNVYWFVVSSPPPDKNLPVVTVASQERGKQWINLPLSVTSNGLRLNRLEELPLLKHALPTLATTVEPWFFTYDIIVGVDTGDPWYTTPGNLTAIGEWWARLWQATWGGQYPLPALVFHINHNTASRNVWAVNYAAQHAYEAGADYFYRINDDTELHKNNWSSAFVATLASFKPFPGCGVVGPHDPWPSYALLTHSFVGRCHFAIFGGYFPPTFHNYFSDDWIGAVYQVLPASFGPDAVMMKILDTVTVRHVVLPERYERMATTALYNWQLSIDRVVLCEFGEKRLKKQQSKP